MRGTFETDNLRKLCSMALIAKDKTPTLEKVTIEASPEGLTFTDGSLDVIAVKGVISKKFLTELDAPAPENVVITKNLYEQLRTPDKFTDKTITIAFDSANVILSNKGENWKDEATSGEPGKMPFPANMITTAKGLVPSTMEGKAFAMCLFHAEELQKLPTAEKLVFELKNKVLSVIVRGAGEYTKTLTPTKIEGAKDAEHGDSVPKEFKQAFDGSYFNKIVSNLEGDIWLSFTPIAAVFSSIAKDYAITYSLSILQNAE